MKDLIIHQVNIAHYRLVAQKWSPSEIDNIRDQIDILFHFNCLLNK